jgi:hypothetical protein
MKTAGRENPNRWVATPSNRAHGAERQNRPCSTRWAAKQEKLQPLEWCFFLTSPFRELTGTLACFGDKIPFMKRIWCCKEFGSHGSGALYKDGFRAVLVWRRLGFLSLLESGSRASNRRTLAKEVSESTSVSGVDGISNNTARRQNR